MILSFFCIAQRSWSTSSRSALDVWTLQVQVIRGENLGRLLGSTDAAVDEKSLSNWELQVSDFISEPRASTWCFHAMS